MTCSVEGCPEPIRAKGICNRHYKLVRHHGTTDLLRKRNPDRCGDGSPYGCGGRVRYPAAIVFGCRPVTSWDDGASMYHLACKPEGTRGVFLERLLAEIRARA